MPDSPLHSQSRVTTPQGQFVGVVTSDGVCIFRGIPFAKPLTPTRRFLPPEPPEPGNVDATRYGPPAAQHPDKLDLLWGEVLAPGAEDCLTLNIWTPPPGEAPYPVLVFIHGGAFVIGSGRQGWYDGTKLARRGKFIVVTINYRLGVLGFLDLREFGSAYSSSGNLGLLDQIRALEWVRDNIAAFGGNPRQVTLLGQSAGAISVSCLMSSPRAEGLFQRAVCLSGAPTLVRTPEMAAAITKKYLQIVKADTPEELRELHLERLMDAQLQLMKKSDFGAPQLMPTLDGEVLPDYPLRRIGEGAARNIALLTGTTRDEMRLWKLYVPKLWGVPPRAFRGWLKRILGPEWHQALATYQQKRDRPGPSTFSMTGDVLFKMPVIRLAEMHSDCQPDTRVYRFDWELPHNELGSPHSLDVGLLFGNLGNPGMQRFTAGMTNAPEAVEQYQAVITAFVQGRDTVSGLPTWPPYRRTERNVMILGPTPRVERDPDARKRTVWDGIPFDGSHPAPTNLPRKREIFLYMIIWVLIRVGIVLGLLLLLVFFSRFW